MGCAGSKVKVEVEQGTGQTGPGSGPTLEPLERAAEPILPAPGAAAPEPASALELAAAPETCRPGLVVGLDSAGMDAGVAQLINRFAHAAVAGARQDLWMCLGEKMQMALDMEAREQTPPQVAQEWCMEKYQWRWSVSRGSLHSLRVDSFDGVMCGVHTKFDTGALLVEYKDVLWVDNDRITATRSECLLTSEERRQLAHDLVSHCVHGRQNKVWQAMSTAMKTHYAEEGAAEQNPISGEEMCRRQHTWAAGIRGQFGGASMISFDEGTHVAEMHVYFAQGGVEQVRSVPTTAVLTQC